MNGTLLYREKHRLEPKSGRIPDMAPSPPRVDHTLGVRYFYYIRPGAKELVEALFGCPNATIGFYTSMQGSNASPAVDFMVGRGWGRQKGHGQEMKAHLFDRRYNKKDPLGENDWDTMRDL
jgi:hypothetical protein